MKWNLFEKGSQKYYSSKDSPLKRCPIKGYRRVSFSRKGVEGLERVFRTTWVQTNMLPNQVHLDA